jgi:aminoglycoside phosphotransferase (APT) family kinase protein
MTDFLSTFTSCEPIDNGGSGDEKYCLTAKNGEKFFLRTGVFDADSTAYAASKRAETLGILMPKTIEFGLYDNDARYYWIQTWLDGKSLLDVLPTLPKSEQYEIGRKAGEILSIIHSLPAEDGAEKWSIWFGEIINLVISEIRKTQGTNEMTQKIITFVENRLEILDKRPQTFCHGDWGIGNLILTSKGEIAATDFGSLYYRNYGDPWAEVESYWVTGSTPAYLKGEMSAYFRDDIPCEFNEVQLFYDAYDSLRVLLLEPELTKNVEKWYSLFKNKITQ